VGALTAKKKLPVWRVELSSNEIMPLDLRGRDLRFGGSAAKYSLENAIATNLKAALWKSRDIESAAPNSEQAHVAIRSKLVDAFCAVHLMMVKRGQSSRVIVGLLSVMHRKPEL
jgi:hypothetical protein